MIVGEMVVMVEVLVERNYLRHILIATTAKDANACDQCNWVNILV